MLPGTKNVTQTQEMKHSLQVEKDTHHFGLFPSFFEIGRGMLYPLNIQVAELLHAANFVTLAVWHNVQQTELIIIVGRPRRGQ